MKRFRIAPFAIPALLAFLVTLGVAVLPYGKAVAAKPDRAWWGTGKLVPTGGMLKDRVSEVEPTRFSFLLRRTSDPSKVNIYLFDSGRKKFLTAFRGYFTADGTLHSSKSFRQRLLFKGRPVTARFSISFAMRAWKGETAAFTAEVKAKAIGMWIPIASVKASAKGIDEPKGYKKGMEDSIRLDDETLFLDIEELK